MASSLRVPAVAGRFYPGEPRAMAQQLTRLFRADLAPRPVKALVGPHAGWIYSGAILGETYARTVVPRRVIVMCPNHTGRGVPRSAWGGGAWQIPGATIPIAEALRAELVQGAGLELDLGAHETEHAIEVHLPFLRAARADVEVVPIVLAGLTLAQCRAVASGIATVVRRHSTAGDSILVVASTDMSHYHDAETAHELDFAALDPVLALDPARLYETVRSRGISMCGFIPTTVALLAAIELGATKAELVRYGHSGETSGDNDRVVGYAGVLVD